MPNSGTDRTVSIRELWKRFELAWALESVESYIDFALESVQGSVLILLRSMVGHNLNKAVGCLTSLKDIDLYVSRVCNVKKQSRRREGQRRQRNLSVQFEGKCGKMCYWAWEKNYLKTKYCNNKPLQCFKLEQHLVESLIDKTNKQK